MLGVTFRLSRDELSAPVRYAELAKALGVGEGERVPLADARAAVLDAAPGQGDGAGPGRPGQPQRGLVLHQPGPGPRRSSPSVERRAEARSGHPVSVPRYPAPDGQVKISAAWLIEQAGFGKGYPAHGRARISSKHTLALTNPGGADTASLIGLAREIRDGVRQAFGVDLVNEPVLVGTQLLTPGSRRSTSAVEAARHDHASCCSQVCSNSIDSAPRAAVTVSRARKGDKSD